MTAEEFKSALEANAAAISQIRELAHGIHDGVSQKYDKTHPYWFHLDMVADNVRLYGAEVCARPEDAAPMLFGAYFHDAIEDARLTYNDVLALARNFFDEEQAVLAAEIAYALTNEKGRTRAERANDKYYQGIRATPYAPLVKLADRLANASYSARGLSSANNAMLRVYTSENPHFLASISSNSPDSRLSLPKAMVSALLEIFANDND